MGFNFQISKLKTQIVTQILLFLWFGNSNYMDLTWVKIYVDGTVFCQGFHLNKFLVENAKNKTKQEIWRKENGNKKNLIILYFLYAFFCTNYIGLALERTKKLIAEIEEIIDTTNLQIT